MDERKPASNAGGGIRTLKPARAVVFETGSHVKSFFKSDELACRAGGRSIIENSSVAMCNCFDQEDSMDIKAAIQEYLASKELNWTHDTYRWCNFMLFRFQMWCKEQNLTELSQLTAVHVAQFANAEPKLSDNTKRGRVQVVKGFLRWCSIDPDLGVRERVVKRIEMPRVEQPEVSIYSEQEIKRLLEACAKTRYHLRNRAIVLLLLDTGIRAAECCYDSDRPEETTGLKVSDVVLGQRGNESYIIVMGKGRKPRTVKLGNETRLALMRYIDRERPRDLNHDFLFVAKGREPLTARGLESLMENLGESARVENAHPHRFRHTFAIRQLMSGTDSMILMQLMGHTSLESTRVYLRALTQLQARQASVSVVDEMRKAPHDSAQARLRMNRSGR